MNQIYPTLFAILFFTTAAVSPCTVSPCTAADEVVIELAAGRHDRQATPVSVEIPQSLAKQRNFLLMRLDTGQRVPVQIDPVRIDGKRPRLVWMVRDVLEAGNVRKYRLSAAKEQPAVSSRVSVDMNRRHLVIRVGDRPVLQYNHAVVPSPIEGQPYYARSGYIHPLYNPRGQAVTDDFAPDHPHQHGIMFPWTNSTFEGRPVDFWNQKKQQGNVEHDKFVASTGGPVFGQFQASLRHVDLSAPGGGKPALDETWHVRVYHLSEYFLIDFESRQACAGESPLAINQYHYGAFAIRGHRDWVAGAGDFLTNEGKTRNDGNHSRPHWCDIHGPIDGDPTGVTIMCHPDNFRFPQPVRLHPKMPYFCFAPQVPGPFRIEPGKPYVSRYRLLVHNGELDAAEADRIWQDFASPPQVKVVSAE